MKKQKLTILSLFLVCSLLLSGCNLFRNNAKKSDADSIGTEVEETQEIDADEESKETEVEETTEDSTETESTEVENTEIETESESEDETTASREPEKTPSNSQTPTNTERPSSSQTPEISVVDMVTEQETLASETYKYGVSRTGVIDRTYEVYSDGSKVCVAEYPSYTYDTSTYNASDAEIQAESDANSNSYMGYYQEVLTLVNQIRSEVGVGPLTLDANLCRAASMRALEMDYADYFEHARADGRSCFSAMDYYGCPYGCAGENIAAGYGSPASVVEGWKNSQGHYENMIDPNFTKLGVGYSNAAPYGYSSYWVQLFSN